MTNRIRLLMVLVAVPVAGYYGSNSIQGWYDSEIQEVFTREYPDADAGAVQAITLSSLCDDPSTDMVELCTTYNNLVLIRYISVSAGISGFTVVVFIKLSGLIARISRRVLLVVFKPGLYFTAIFLAGLVVIHALIVIGSLWYLSTLAGRIPIGFIVLIGIGALVGVLVLLNSLAHFVKKAQTSVIGLPLIPSRAPELYRNVEAIAKKLGTSAPQNIVVGLDPNFFVTEADVVCLGDTLSGRTLYCSLPFCRLMSIDEINGVIGHELGHFKGLDTEFSEKFYPIYRGTANALAELQQTQGVSLLPMLPAIAVLTFFYDAFAIAENTHSRKREFAADREGANASSAESLASALIKVHAIAPYWAQYQEISLEMIQDGKIYVNVSRDFAEAVQKSANAEILDGIAESRVSHPTDSHPPLAARLESLNVQLQSVASRSLDLQPEMPANRLISDADNLEEEISEAHQMVLVHLLKNAAESEGNTGGAAG